jgi:ribonuclease P protein component
MRFPRARRITRRSDFQRVRRKGRSYRGRHMIVGVLSDGEIRSLKVGYITTRRVGNAVARSGIRRRLRGIVQRHGEHLQCGHWLVMIPHAQSGGISSAELERDWLKLVRRAGILEAETEQPQEPEALPEK